MATEMSQVVPPPRQMLASSRHCLNRYDRTCGADPDCTTIARCCRHSNRWALVIASRKDQTRWSRQISSYTADISDWVPLTGPIEKDTSHEKRQAVAEPRILSEPFPELSRSSGFSQETFPSRSFYNSPANRQLYLQSIPSVPSAPQNYLTDQGFGQSIRFGLAPANFPLSQGFVAPQFAFENVAQIKPKPQAIPNSPIKFETGPKTQAVPQTRYISQTSNIQPDSGTIERFVDGYRAENATGFNYNTKSKPQSEHKVQFENFDKINTDTNSQNAPKVEREEVQLLYVPLESLNRGQFNFRSPITTSQLVNTNLYSQGLPRPTTLKQPVTDFQRPVETPLDTFSKQDYFTSFNSQLRDLDQIPKFSTVSTPFPTIPPSTPKSKKLKPHQPPLAIFLTQESVKSNQMKVSDVLSSLKSASTIAVLDSVNPLNAPKVFIGPSTLTPPENYVKFELPYLSNIENSDKKLKQLPFFVAPLSYNTPQGFAKIPFPSPHVGSVVINSQIRDSQTTQTTLSSLPPKTYQPISPSYQQQIPITQKPPVNFYSTAPPRVKSPPSNYQSNYYSFEPQSVSSHRPLNEHEIITSSPKTVNYFLGNPAPQYNSQHVQFPETEFRKTETINYNIPKKNETPITTPKRTITTTTKKPPSTYPNQLLETHNPYSINQAFHFSTPLDYHNYFEDVKEPIPTPRVSEFRPTPTLSPSKASQSSRSQEVNTENNIIRKTSPTYLQNYSPEIHYDDRDSKYQDFKPYEYSTKSQIGTEIAVKTTNTPLSGSSPIEYTEQIKETLPSVLQENPTEVINPTAPETESPQTYEINQDENSYNQDETTSTSTTTTTTTARRTPARHRGRPRYTTPKADSNESTYRPTRRPLRERRPLPNRSRYESNKITTEKPTRAPLDTSTEVTTKSSRTRTRGRVQFKSSDSDEFYNRKVKNQEGKEDDIAYQRDVLHQNYPVTLTERRSTVDIEAITEPATKTFVTRISETTTEAYDTENAYTNEKLSYTEQLPNGDLNDDIYIPKYTSRSPIQTETTYVPKSPSTNNDVYHSKSVHPTESVFDDVTTTNKEESYSKDTTETENVEINNEDAYITEAVNTVSEESVPIYSRDNDFAAIKEDDATTSLDIEVTKSHPQETNPETEEEENVVQTTPSYNRVRIRPGVIRQYHQASTESSRVKSERKRPAVTYRPAFDRRRTTMRIEEIEADLKTKQVHSRYEGQDYKHPVYKPDPSTEPTVPSSTQETTTKRHIRRRRPNYSYTTTSSDISATRRPYETKGRFRGRRPTEKPTEKPEPQTESTTSTTRNPLHTRYSHRPRLSERYNKKTESEDLEDQDSNYSINIPRYAEPDKEYWSPKISSDSFKPYNPNDILDDNKIATTERAFDNAPESDIITAKNEYEDILVSVTPTSNNRNAKKIPEIPPTLEALVEQSKVTKSDSPETMSTFESMLEEVMKSLEEQDEDEYTSKVTKHKGGEIGEIPPEKIISPQISWDIYAQKHATEVQEQDVTTVETTAADFALHNEEENDSKNRRRGYWKRIKVRPVTTESFEVAESQYYTSTVNRLGEPVSKTKLTHEKSKKNEKKVAATTYKPKYEFIKDIFETEDESIDVLPTIDIPKLKVEDTKKPIDDDKQTTAADDNLSTEKVQINPGDLDLGTGSPDSTVDDTYFTTPMELTTNRVTTVDKSDGFSLMDYLFGVPSQENENSNEKTNTITDIAEVEIASENMPKIATTESSYIPDEIATENWETTAIVSDTGNKTKQIKEDVKTETSVTKLETSSVSSNINLTNVVSTSTSTQVSHETEICFRGKCIKTNKNINF